MKNHLTVLPAVYEVLLSLWLHLQLPSFFLEEI